MRTTLAALALVGLIAAGVTLADSGPRVDLRTVEAPLSLTIAPTQQAYPLGESPQFAVRVKNHTGQPVWLVGALDGSFSHRRAPRFVVETQRPGGAWTRVGFIIGCKFMNVLREQDVIEVPAGAEFDPFRRVDDGGFFGQPSMAHAFAEPGEYQVRLTYSTAALKDEDWQGTGVMTAAARAKLAKVPRTTLVSNPVTVRVVPKP